MYITPEKHFEQQQKHVGHIFEEWRRNQNPEKQKELMMTIMIRMRDNPKRRKGEKEAHRKNKRRDNRST